MGAPLRPRNWHPVHRPNLLSRHNPRRKRRHPLPAKPLRTPDASRNRWPISRPAQNLRSITLRPDPTNARHCTYLMRSRIDNISAALNNLIFVDPTQVSVPDLIDRNPYGVVRTLPGSKPGDGVFIAQVPDVTRGHFQDIQAMSELKQRVSAASDAQQGMPTAGGVRTATEVQRLSQLGSQRLGVLARVMSATTIRPMVRMMVANIQDSLTLSGSINIDGQKHAQTS